MGEDRIVMRNSALDPGFKQGLRAWRVLPLLLTLLLMAIGIAAGIWQTGRAVTKEQIEVKLRARDQLPALTQAPRLDAQDAAQLAIQLAPYEYRHLRVKGEFVRNWPIFLENRPYQNKVGFYVLMPFKLSGSAEHILVARGWVARDLQDRRKIPQISTPFGEVEIEGVIRQQAGRLLQLGARPAIVPGAIVQNVEVAEFANASNLHFQPYIVEQLATAGSDGLIRDWPRPSSGVDKHRGYAFQWFGLAALACIFYIYTGIRRARNSKQ